MTFVFVSMNLLDTVNEMAKATSHDAASLSIYKKDVPLGRP
ncbi:hypothetical protein HMPREF9429_00534 [Megasphaera micronuciformis F0359]|uniref:Uncharacterized protein n=1 Tax=Megasphaera micronuciformis F0359 TaxID=706434 RepID=E2ZAR6_9FIRM|nr:hypothetical protein HMPREF9429_00534 [Megasphaera micronuciformis F0359]